TTGSAECWLIVSDDMEDRTGLVAALERSGARVERRASDATTTLPPGAFDGVIIANDLDGDRSIDALRPLHALTQAYFDDTRLRRVIVATRGALALAGEAPAWRAAIRHGYARVLEHERPSWSVGVVDFDPHASRHAQQHAAEHCLDWLETESLVAVRRGRCW